MALKIWREFFYSQLFATPPLPTRSFAGETVIVTGANVGLGKEAARHLARLGASKVILAVRNVSAGEAAKLDIDATTSCGKDVVEVWPLDLSSFDSVKAFAARCTATVKRLDVLLENAGIAPVSGWETAEGHEIAITVNVISTFLLALLLLPKMRETSRRFNVAPRITVVTSGAQAAAAFKERHESDIFAALSDRERADMADRYAVTKCLEVMLVRELAPRLEGSGVVINATAPGMCHSQLTRHTSGMQAFVFGVMKLFLARTTEVGGRALVADAAAGPETHGKYLNDGVVQEERLGEKITSEEGTAVAAEVWKQLSKILEEAAPGVTKNLQ